LLSRADLKLFKYLLAGAVVSGPLYLSIALVSIAERPDHPAVGGYHHITFGDMAMLGAMFMTTVLVTMKTSKVMKIVLVISIVCLLYASILSTARGAWLAMPFCLSLLLGVGIHQGMIKLRTILVVLLMLGVAVVVSPARHIISSGVHEAADDIEVFQSGEKEMTSVGSRLGMWHVAVNIWKKHPVIGTGPGDFDLEMQASSDEGLYEELFAHSSAHNIYFQALATTGTIGFVIMCFALVALPFRLFYRANKGKVNVAAVSGMVAITAFAVFGLTESWMLRSPVIAVYVMYFVTLATSAKKTH
jgi:O-antigen ligase